MIAPFDREAVLEETIADLEALYDYHAMILSQARVGVLDWPVNDARVYMSPCLKSMLGYDDNELPDAFTEWLKHRVIFTRVSRQYGERTDIESAILLVKRVLLFPNGRH